MFGIGDLKVVRMGAADVRTLQELHERCRDFVELVHGIPPRPNEAAELLTTRPDGTAEEDKFVLGVFEGEPGRLIGAVDLIRGYPEPGEWFIGLLMLDPAHRGAGLGARIHTGLEQWVRGQGATGLRLIVQKQNPGALRFWQRQGYAVIYTGTHQAPGRESVIDLLRKPLPGGPRGSA